MEGFSKKDMSRRSFLRNAVAGGIAAGAVSLGAEGQRLEKPFVPETSVDTEERLKSIARLETPDAQFVIEYCHHGLLSTPDVLQGSDALLLELVADFSTADRVEKQVKKQMESHASEWRPYTELIARALRERKPIFFVDMQADGIYSRGLLSSVENSNLIKDLEIAAGGLIAGAELSTAVHKRTGKIGSDVLPTAARVTLAGWLLSHAPERVSNKIANSFSTTTPDERSVARGLEKRLGRINHTLHPETHSMATQTRDALIAQKSLTIGRLLAQELGRKPQLALEVGANHFGVENELRANASDRIARLKAAYGAGLKEQASIARIDVVETDGEGERISVSIINDSALGAVDSQVQE